MNFTSNTKLVKKYIGKICCCSGCLKHATIVYGIIDIGLAAFVIVITVIYLYNYEIKTNLDLFYISANNLKNIILDIIIVMQSCNIVACILLLFGNQLGRRNYLCPYVIMGFIRLVVIFLMIILLIFGKQWKLLLYCLGGMGYAICSLHVVGERDKELSNQLASKLKSLKISSPSVSSSKDTKMDIYTIKEQAKFISLEEYRRFKMLPTTNSHHQKIYKREERKTKNNKPSASTLSLSSNTYPSSPDSVSDNHKLYQFPMSSQVSRSTFFVESSSSRRHKSPTSRRSKSSKGHRPKSSISLTSLNEAAEVSESVDLLLSKSEDPLISESVDRRQVRYQVQSVSSELRTDQGDPLISKSESGVSLSASTLIKAIKPYFVDPVRDLDLNKVWKDQATPRQQGRSTLTRALDTTLPKSTNCLIENTCVVNYEICKQFEMDALNGPSCKLCQLCPSSFGNKENVSVCDSQNKNNFAQNNCENNENSSNLQFNKSKNYKVPDQTSMSTYIAAQIEHNKDSEQIPMYGEKEQRNSNSIRGLNEIHDNEKNDYRFSQIVLGDNEIDASIIDS